MPLEFDLFTIKTMRSRSHNIPAFKYPTGGEHCKRPLLCCVFASSFPLSSSFSAPDDLKPSFFPEISFQKTSE